MIDEEFPEPDLRDKTREELYQQRWKNKVDPWTLAWWKRQFDELMTSYKACCHAINQAVARTLETRDQVAELNKRIDALETENQMNMARLGELHADNVKLYERMEAMAAWAKDMEKEIKPKRQPANVG